MAGRRLLVVALALAAGATHAFVRLASSPLQHLQQPSSRITHRPAPATMALVPTVRHRMSSSHSRLLSILYNHKQQPQQPQPHAMAAVAVRGGAAPAGPSRPPCDYKALATYVGATALQLAAIGGFLWCMEWAFAALNLAPVVKLWVVRLFFAFTSLKSRVFSVLDNSRPSVAREEQRKRERKRPGWM